MLLAELVETSAAVARTRTRKEKVERLAALLRRAAPAELEVGVAWLTGVVPGGALGVGPALVRAVRPGTAAATGALEVLEVQRELRALAEVSGAGSKGERERRLAALFARATADEQHFLARLLVGELRQGALGGLLTDAIARAAEVPLAVVRRAAMLSGDLPEIGRVALTEGAAGLARFRLELFRPLQPMLAQPAADAAEALAYLGTAALELKLDGARVQVHKAGEEVRVWSRRLHEVTAAVPEVVEAVRALPARELVLDGEAIAFLPEEPGAAARDAIDALEVAGAAGFPRGRPRPFQETMRRFGRRLEVARMRAELPLDALFFDVLYADGAELVDAPAAERFAALAEILPPRLVVPRLVTTDPAEAERFVDAAIERGHEGAMAKALDAPYAAGARGRSWLKLKLAHTLDLVVLAAEWGSGRREGWLSNLHLGARDPATNGFVMLGKTFKGLTDELLAWQTRELLARELGRDAYTVHVAPELVVEIAFSDVQASPQYPGGLALRFARVKRYRPDRTAADADTIDVVRALQATQAGGGVQDAS